MNSNVLALIDIGIYWAFWHAADKASDSTQSAIDRFVGMCRSISLRHRRTIVCADSPLLFRRQIPGGEGYKRREEKPEAGAAGLAAAERELSGLGLTLWRQEGYEADDGIAAWADAAVKSGWLVRIYSEDKDLEALVFDGHVSIYKRDTEKGGMVDWTEEHVRNRRGVPPSRIAEFLALAGDSADCVPGVKGLGVEAAKAIINHYAHVYDAYKDIGPDSLPAQAMQERVRKALKAHREAFDLSYALVKLDTSAAKHIDLKLLEIPQEDPPGDDDTPPGVGCDDERTAEPSHAETTANGAQAQVLAEVKREEQKPASMLDQVAEHTDQKARAEGWIGRSFEQALEPRTARDAWWLAGQLHNAMSPGKGRNAPPVRTYAKIGNKEAIFAVILKGRELGLPAMLSLAHIRPVEGKIEVDAMLMMALALSRGRVERFRWIETTEVRAAIEIVVDGRVVPYAWDIDMAKKAGLFPPRRGDGTPDEYSPWGRYTRVMLRWRCVSEVLRANVPEVVVGLYAKGEVGEIDDDDIRSGLDAEKNVS